MTMQHVYVETGEELERGIPSDIIKLIRKLRWIGMEDEARTLQRSLRAMRPTDSVLAGPTETD
jgi:hypothetical protein